MSNKMVIYTKSEGVATIKLNSPKTMNALTGDLVDELKVAIQDAATDESIGAVILTGTDKAFCAGGDGMRHVVDCLFLFHIFNTSAVY